LVAVALQFAEEKNLTMDDDYMPENEPNKVFVDGESGAILYIGSRLSAHSRRALEHNKIVAIVNTAIEIENKFDDDDKLSYLKMDFDDSIEEQLVEACTPALRFIDEHVAKGHNVLVHCQAGISRSATLVLVWLIARHMTLRDAFFRLKDARESIQPNSGFFEQLGELDKRVHGQISFSLEAYLLTVFTDMGFGPKNKLRDFISRNAELRFNLLLSLLIDEFAS
jgi:protein-tyrosine phosphatase